MLACTLAAAGIQETSPSYQQQSAKRRRNSQTSTVEPRKCQQIIASSSCFDPLSCGLEVQAQELSDVWLFNALLDSHSQAMRAAPATICHDHSYSEPEQEFSLGTPGSQSPSTSHSNVEVSLGVWGAQSHSFSFCTAEDLDDDADSSGCSPAPSDTTSAADSEDDIDSAQPRASTYQSNNCAQDSFSFFPQAKAIQG